MLNDKVIAREKCQELKKLVGDELSIVATFLQLLMEFSRDKRHEQLGFASLWDFCRKGLASRVVTVVASSSGGDGNEASPSTRFARSG